MKPRLATIFTLLALVGGTGGALAVASSGGSGHGQSAAASQYKPGQRCGHHKNDPCPVHHRYHYHCYYQGHYYTQCPYARAVKGVHVVRHRRHHRPPFTG